MTTQMQPQAHAHDHPHPHEHPHVEDNSHAGQGAVLLDIGGTIGALVVTMPGTLVGHEVEIRPAGEVDGHHPHVGVVERPRDGRADRAGDASDMIASAVFPSLEQGEYELYLKPDGPVQVTAKVTGGCVEFATWPA